MTTPKCLCNCLPLADYVVCLDRRDLTGVAELMLRSARKLAAAGAAALPTLDSTRLLAKAAVRRAITT